jgi:hypothetical protein
MIGQYCSVLSHSNVHWRGQLVQVFAVETWVKIRSIHDGRVTSLFLSPKKLSLRIDVPFSCVPAPSPYLLHQHDPGAHFKVGDIVFVKNTPGEMDKGEIIRLKKRCWVTKGDNTRVLIDACDLTTKLSDNQEFEKSANVGGCCVIL